MIPVSFNFKRYKAENVPQPIIDVTFTHKDKKVDFACVIDSGADYTLLPMSFGIMLGIDFEQIASKPLIRDFMYSDRADPTNIMDRIIEIGYGVIPTSSVCACGKTTNCFLYPVFVKLGDNDLFPIMVIWTPNNVPPLLGRIGVFDKFSSVVFNKRNSDGSFIP